MGRGLARSGLDFLLCDTKLRLAGCLLLTALTAFYALYLRTSLPDSPKYESLSAKKRSMWENVKSVWARQYIRPTVMLSIVWFCVVFSYYGMFLWLPSVMLLKGFSMIQSFEYVLLMTLAQLPGYFSAAWLIEKAGRKWILVVYLIGTAGSAYFFGTADSLSLLLTAGVLLSFFNLGAWGVLYAYTRSNTRLRFEQQVQERQQRLEESAASSGLCSSEPWQPVIFRFRSSFQSFALQSYLRLLVF